jgi:hypothetical protein
MGFNENSLDEMVDGWLKDGCSGTRLKEGLNYSSHFRGN